MYFETSYRIQRGNVMDSLLCLTKSRLTATFIPPSPHSMCLSVCGSVSKADCPVVAETHCQGKREEAANLYWVSPYWHALCLLVTDDMTMSPEWFPPVRHL